MSGDYGTLARFIRNEIKAVGLEINRLDITRSAIRSITRRFEELGWTTEAVPGATSRFSRYRIVSPDGSEVLFMLGGKVYRHPEYTEQICRRKHLTKRMLDLKALPMPIGGDFSPREKEVAAAYFDQMPKPVVVKATDSGGSKGVTVGVRERADFEVAWQHALAEGRETSNVLIEQFVRGVELRAFVVGAEVVSVVARIQPFVVGTGDYRLENLIEKDHEARKVHYRAMKMPVVVNWDFVGKQGHDKHSIPAKDEVVFLNPFNTPTIGASVLDVTGSVCQEIKNMAQRAKDAIPRLEIAGVDLLVEDLNDESTAYVLEVNTAATLELHRYPTHGTPRSVDEDIVDYFHAEYSKNL